MSEVLDKAYERGRIDGAAMLGATRDRWYDMARELANVIGWPKEKLIEEIERFDADRLDAVPALATYPELRGYRDRIDSEDRGKRDAGAEDTLIALARSTNDYTRMRLFAQTGKAWYAEAKPEKCRVLYAPSAKGGAIHVKNVDDPATYFTPQPSTPPGTPWPWKHPLVWDGTGSGLHIDEVPPEIFPVAVREFCLEHCTTIPEATEFLIRYNYFWHSQNTLLHDHHGNSMAFEKTACRVATRGPNEHGVNFVTGMGASDPAIVAHQRAMRDKYLDQIGQDWDGPNGVYWKVCEGQWRNMTRYVSELPAEPTIEDINALMEKRDPGGPMCKTGTLAHPDLTIPEWTLQMRLYLMEKKQLHLRQYRDGKPALVDNVEVIQYV